jgi:3-hydroxyisobutyrate dehydrogenase-like beta-hydroxyacid dehydrogenase
VLGSVPSAESGGPTILVGGERAVFARHEELLAALGTTAYVGASGAAATLKLVVNASATATLAAVGELLSLTDRAGLDQGMVLDGLQMGPLASFIGRWRERLEDRYERPDFPLRLARKDLALVLAEATGAGIDLSTTRAAGARCDQALLAGLADLDVGAVSGSLRR